MLDDSVDGFEWINNISANDCYLSYARKGIDKKDTLLVVANFAGIPQEITTGVPFAGKYKEIFNTDAKEFGGNGMVNPRVKTSKKKEWDDRPESVTVKLAPLSLSILQYIPYTEEELQKLSAKAATSKKSAKSAVQKKRKK